MGIGLVRYEHPGVVGRCGYCPLDVRNKVGLRARLAHTGSDLCSRRNVEVGNQALRAVAHVFVFLAFALAGLTRDTGLPWFCRRRAFKRLDAGLLIRARQADALRMECRSLPIKSAHGFDVLIERRCLPVWGMEPVFNPMGFRIALILKTAGHWPGRCG